MEKWHTKPYFLISLIAFGVVSASAVAGALRDRQIFSDMQTAQTAKPDISLAEISADELQVMMDKSKKLVIVDARAVEDYNRGHIPGAKHLRARDATVDRLAAILPQKDFPVVFYCTNTHCPASGKAAYKAAQAGYKTLYKYRAGIEDWKARGLPVVDTASES